MAIAGNAPVIEEEIGGQPRRLVLRNSEIERFEAQYASRIIDGVEYAGTGIFDLFDQLNGRGPAPQLRHVRDLVALAMVGGGMSDRAADSVMAEVGPDQAIRLRIIAQCVLGAAFVPSVLEPQGKKKLGSRKVGPAE